MTKMFFKKNKKAQEESMGFVIIVLILIVAGIVFFGFSLRKPGNYSTEKQQELADLTWAILSYTTNCSILEEQKNIWELSKECNRRESQKCDNNINVCDYLNETINSILNELKGNEQNLTMANKKIHGYEFIIEMNNKKINVSKGNLSGNYLRYITFIPSDINVTSKFYYD